MMIKRYKVKAKASSGETQGGQHRRRGQDGYGGRALQVWLMNTLFVKELEILKNDYFKRNHIFRAKELALADPDPQLFTMATLTGHAVLAVGWAARNVQQLEDVLLFYQVGEYSTIMDNGPARAAGTALKVG